MKDEAEQPGFRAIADDLASALRHYLERYVGDPAVAQDLSQETLLRINQGLPGFSGRSSVKTWAFAIANRVAADYLRHPDRRWHIVDLDEAAEVPDPDIAVDEKLVLGEMNACIRAVIDSLPDTYRAALVLHDLEGLSTEQTAEICDCTLATAKIRIHRARQRLKEALSTHCAFYRDLENGLRCDRKAGQPDRDSASV
jgi:RNA polymerase sigma-70 factor (ECF subfamily)